ncbi:MAG TPA: EamA family transporter [Jatrophihabitantaceae bacterium]|jgi:DME family drug/metabolite transporter|nr:EamA family transporter [Jatrophihabitantaceae bacterium]
MVIPSRLRTRLGARSGLFAVSAGALLWGTTGVAVAIVHDRSGLSAVPIGCLRLIIAAIALFALFGRSGWQRARLAFSRHRWRLVVAGAGLGIYQALYFVGVQYVGVSVSTLVSLAVAPVALTAWGALTRRRLPGPGASLIVAAAVAGLVLISVGRGAHAGGSHPLVGLLASVAAGLGYAATTVVNHRIAIDGDPLLLTGATSAIGAIVLVPIAVPIGLYWPHDAIASGWLIYIGIVPTALAYGLFYLGLRSVSSETAGVLSLLEPLAAAVLAAVALHERLGPLGLIGGAVLLVAIAGMYLRQPEPAVPPL